MDIEVLNKALELQKDNLALIQQNKTQAEEITRLNKLLKDSITYKNLLPFFYCIEDTDSTLTLRSGTLAGEDGRELFEQLKRAQNENKI